MISNNKNSKLLWGSKEWRIFHKKALEFSEKPSEKQQEEFKKFYEDVFKARIPCNVCKIDYEDILKKLPVKLGSKTELFNWTIDVHNIINAKLNKEKIEYDVAQQELAKENKSTDTLIKETPTGSQCTGQVIDQETLKKIASIPKSNNNAISNKAPRITTSIFMTTYLPNTTISGHAILVNCKDPTETITFNVYEQKKNCMGDPIFTCIVKVNGNGRYTSKPFTCKTPGIYYWVAHYSGDKQNEALHSQCGENKVLQ